MLLGRVKANRDRRAAYRFLKKILKKENSPKVINTDKNAAYPIAINQLKQEKSLQQTTALRRDKYLNNIIEQDHRFIKKQIKPMLNFKSFLTAQRTLKGIKVMNIIRKGQVVGIEKDTVSQVKFIHCIFEVAN